MEAENRPARATLQLGTVIPWLLGLGLVLDVLTRLLPVDSLTFRGWEALTRFRPPGAAFEPGRRYENPRSYGDLAALGNLRDLRQYRPEIFSTDSLGFRNPGVPDAPPAAFLLVGDSFAVGSGVSDEANLSSLLTRELGQRVYNAAGADLTPGRIASLARRVHLTSGLVLYEYCEDRDPPEVPSGVKGRYLELLGPLETSGGGVIGRSRGFLTVSPLGIVCEKALKQLQDGRELPDASRSNVVQADLVTGDTMLFQAAAVKAYHSARRASSAVWPWLQQELRGRGLRLVVVLVPGKYRVLRPFLCSAPVGAGGRYLEDLEADLVRDGVPVFNLTSALTAETFRDLPRREYLYWRDDIHWNPRGTEVAARALTPFLRTTLEEAPGP